RAVPLAHRAHHLQRLQLLAGLQALVPELDDVHAAGEGGVQELLEVAPLAPGVGAQVEAGAPQALPQALRLAHRARLAACPPPPSGRGAPARSSSSGSAASTAPSRPGKRASRSSRRSRIHRFRPTARVLITPASRNTLKWCESVDLCTVTLHASAAQLRSVSTSMPPAVRSASRRSRTGSDRASRTAESRSSARSGWGSRDMGSTVAPAE